MNVMIIQERSAEFHGSFVFLMANLISILVASSSTAFEKWHVSKCCEAEYREELYLSITLESIAAIKYLYFIVNNLLAERMETLWEKSIIYYSSLRGACGGVEYRRCMFVSRKFFGKSNLVNKFIFSDSVLDFCRLPTFFFFPSQEEVDKRNGKTLSRTRHPELISRSKISCHTTL